MQSFFWKALVPLCQRETWSAASPIGNDFDSVKRFHLCILNWSTECLFSPFTSKNASSLFRKSDSLKTRKVFALPTKGLVRTDVVVE